MTTLKNSATAQLADNMIGAAQELERAAKRLKQDAANIRREGLSVWPDFPDPIENQRMHKHADIKRAATSALQAFGTMTENDWLTEYRSADYAR